MTIGFGYRIGNWFLYFDLIDILALGLFLFIPFLVLVLLALFVMAALLWPVFEVIRFLHSLDWLSMFYRFASLKW